MPRVRDARAPHGVHTGHMPPPVAASRDSVASRDSAASREPAPPLSGVPGWVGDVIAAVLIVGAALGASMNDPDAQLTGILVAMAPAALLPFRRRWPKTILGLCLILYPIAAVLGGPAPGMVIAIAIATFGVANRTTRRAALMVGFLTVTAIALLALAYPLTGVIDPRVFQVVITVAFAAAAGDATRSRREYLQAMRERAERAEATKEAEAKRRVAEERVRIARDLHDIVAHQISVISLNAGVATGALRSDSAKAEQSLSAIRTASRTVLSEISDLLAVLRTGDDRDTVGEAPQPGLSRVADLQRPLADAGFEVTAHVEGDISVLPATTDLVAYRVVQEGLTNAQKHGTESRAHVRIHRSPDMLTVTVTNPVGVAPAPTADDTGSRLGLLGLRERVASVGGALEAGPTPGGWRLAATLPLPRRADIEGTNL